MLQRLINKPPAPLRNNQNDNSIFNKDGKLKDQYSKLCHEVDINPEELYFRPLESFYHPDIVRNVQILRYNNYENKRRARVEALRAVAKQLGVYIAPQKYKMSSLTPRTNNRPSFLGNNDVSLNSLDKDSHSLVRDSSAGKFVNGYSAEKYLSKPQFKSKRASSHEMSTFISGSKVNNHTGKPDRDKGISLSNLDAEFDHTNMTDELDDRFKKYIAYKTLEKERLQNASVIVSREDEILRSRQRKAYEDKFERWSQQMENVKKQNAKNKKAEEEEEEYRRERIAQQKETETEHQKVIQKKILQKITRSEIHRKAEISKRLNRLTQVNTFLQERHINFVEKRDAEAETYLEDSMLEIEAKMTKTGFRKRKIIEDQKQELNKHLNGVQEKLCRARENEKEQAHNLLDKIIGKMEKERSRSVLSTKRRSDKEPRPIEMNTDFITRLEEKSMRENILERQKIESLKEREKRVLMSVQRKKLDVKNYIEERRELWNQKIENIHENRGIAHEANEKYLEQKRRNYEEKMSHIKRMKNERKKQLINLNKTIA